MGYITSDHLIEYDAKIKQYIQTQITSATSSYRQQISALTATVADLTARLDALESSSTNNTTTSSTTAAPVLRSLSRGGTLLSVGNDSDSNDSDSGVSLRSIHPQTIVVQEDIQEDYVIYDRTITENLDPPFNDNILVTADNLSNRLYFNIWNTFDDRDLENKEIKIVWTNAKGEKGMSLCTEKQVLDEHRLRFAWDVPLSATVKEGTLSFAVRITTTDYVWNSLIGTVEVRQGLITETFNNLPAAQVEPGWVDYIEGKYKVSIQVLTKQEYEDLGTKSMDVLYVVKLDSGKITLYLGTMPLDTGSEGE